jgi:hypothetical protein
MLYASATRDDPTRISDELFAKQLSLFQPTFEYLIESSNGTDSFENGFILIEENRQVKDWPFRQSGTDFTKAIDAARSLLLKAYQNEELDYIVTCDPSWVIASKNHVIRGVYLGNHRKEGKEEIGEDPVDAEVEKFIEPGQVLTDQVFADTFVRSYSYPSQ